MLSGPLSASHEIEAQGQPPSELRRDRPRRKRKEAGGNAASPADPRLGEAQILMAPNLT